MKRIKIFISSVQNEFVTERMVLYEYLMADALLGKFFEPFLFELLPAIDQRADAVYLKEVEQCDIYLGLLGKNYGFEDAAGISPTEHEFDHATVHHKTRLLFLTDHANDQRHPKELVFINKVQQALIRKRFGSTVELKSSVYAALVHYLIEKEIIRTGPFDATLHPTAITDDLEREKINWFVRSARAKRGFPLTEEADTNTILTHLNLMSENRISHAALLLFGKAPQRFFINSEVRCAYFHGIEISKPIPDYQVYKGDVFELVNQAVDFILAKLSYSVGTRKDNVQVPGGYEIPREIIAEAVVNAVAHRDYTSNGSVQIMLFQDRLEIWNPGMLPLGWSAERLKVAHPSMPANPLLAEPMFLAGYIERLGTGTADMVRIAAQVGLKEPQFVQEDVFKIIIYRPTVGVTEQLTATDTVEATVEVAAEVQKLLKALEGEMKRAEIQTALKLKHAEHFRLEYLIPALNRKLIEMKYPDSPNHPNQRYRLTTKGKELRDSLLKR